MPLYSAKHGYNLLTNKECQDLFSKSERSIRNAAGKHDAAAGTQQLQHTHGHGASKVRLIDPLAIAKGTGWLPTAEVLEHELVRAAESTVVEAEPVELAVRQEDGLKVQASAELAVNDLAPADAQGLVKGYLERSVGGVTQYIEAEWAEAERWGTLVKPLILLASRERGERQRQIAQAEGCSYAWVRKRYRWYHVGRTLSSGETAKGARALLKQPRSDSGLFHVPLDLLTLIVKIKVTNPNASAREVRRLIKDIEPGLLCWEQSKLSGGTIGKVFKWMKRVPELAVNLMDTKELKEFKRVWSGHIEADYANQIWTIDMTRKDIFAAVKRDNGKWEKLRLRIHAAQDVYSGVVVSFVISRSEAQIATDHLLLGALLPKPGHLTALHPYYGKPELIYWDNGKTYLSHKTVRVCEALGIQSVHSMPGSSHTRPIERFFGTTHKGMSAYLPGYSGSDTKRRDEKELTRLFKNTVKWIEAGADPQRDPYPDRLLTDDELRTKFTAWLSMRYHREPKNAKTKKPRRDLFLDTVTAESQMEYDTTYLKVLLSDHRNCVVQPGGQIRFKNRYYTLANGRLKGYEGETVVLLYSPLPGIPFQQIAEKLEDGSLRPLGDAVEITGSALSDQNRELRTGQRQRVKEVKTDAKNAKAILADSLLRQDDILQSKAQLEPARLPAPSKKRVALVDPEAEKRKRIEEAQRKDREKWLAPEEDPEILAEVRRLNRRYLGDPS